MNRKEMSEKLRTSHHALWNACQAMNTDLQRKQTLGKWSALQHIQHVNKGVAAFCRYLKHEKAKIADTFGTTDFRSRTYEQVLLAYERRLSEGAVSTPPFNPEASENISIEAERGNGGDVIEQIIAALDQWTDAELDRYVCPHPNLGKMSVREMIYFLILHADHHHKALEK